MKKTTFLIASIITGIFLCNIPSAQAGMLKIDAGKLAKEVVTSITNFMENFKKMMDESAAIQRAAKMGKGVMETAKQLESIKEEAEDAVNEIKEDPLCKFYLSTDSEAEEGKLKSLFGSSIITQGEKELSRGKEEGILAAYVDLLSLSHCYKIFGSFWSSFSQTAVAIGGGS